MPDFHRREPWAAAGTHRVHAAVHDTDTELCVSQEGEAADADAAYRQQAEQHKVELARLEQQVAQLQAQLDTTNGDRSTCGPAAADAAAGTAAPAAAGKRWARSEPASCTVSMNKLLGPQQQSVLSAVMLSAHSGASQAAGKGEWSLPLRAGWQLHASIEAVRVFVFDTLSAKGVQRSDGVGG
jgi:hypothetical protein